MGKILHRYIVKEIAGPFFLILGVFLFVLLMGRIVKIVEMIVRQGVSPLDVLRLLGYLIPSFLPLAIPMATLIAGVICFSRLSGDMEITAMKANGISLYRIAIPILTIAALTSLLIFFLSEWVTPHTNDRAKNIRLIEVQKQRSLGSFKQDQIWYRGHKGIYNFRLFDAQTSTLQGITIHYLDRNMKLVMRLDAERGEWTEGRWLFRNILITRFDDGEFPVLSRMKQQVVDLPEKPSDFQEVQKDVEVMGYFELKRYIRKLQSEGYDATRYVVDLHGKIAFSLVSIILAVIGVSFSLRSERSGGIAQGIGAGLVIGFSYWLVYAFGMSLGRSGTLPPLIAAWFANILFGAASVFLILRVKT